MRKAGKVFARFGFSDVVVSLEDSKNDDVRVIGEEPYLIGYEDENGEECTEEGVYLNQNKDDDFIFHE